MNDNQATLDTFFGFTQAHAPGSEEHEKLVAALPTDRIKEAIKKSKKKYERKLH